MVRISGVILVDPAGRILLQERDEHAPVDPLLWGFVGGHVEEGESYEDAAYRELAEETGIELAPGTLAEWREFVYPSADGTVALHLYTAPTTLTDESIVVGEGRQIVFVEPTAIAALGLSAATRLAIPEFLASERYRTLRHGAGMRRFPEGRA